MVEGKLGKSLKKVLKKVVAKEAHEQLAITDAKLGGVIKVNGGFSKCWGKYKYKTSAVCYMHSK